MSQSHTQSHIIHDDNLYGTFYVQPPLDRVRKSAEGGVPVASQLVQPMQPGPFEKKISEGKMQLGLVGEKTIWDVYL